MAGFDFIDAGANAYMFAWRERRVLVRLAALPLLVKVISFEMALALGLEEHPLRQGLILLPASFLEGWLVSHAIYLALSAERWVFASPKRALMGGMLAYALTKLASFLLFGLFVAKGASAPPETQPEITAGVLMGLFAFIALTLWAFRLFWLYVPAAMDYSALALLKKIEPYASSFYILGLWLMTSVPPGLAVLAVARALQALFPGAAPDDSSALAEHASIFLQAALEAFTAVVASVGMAYGFRKAIE